MTHRNAWVVLALVLLIVVMLIPLHVESLPSSSNLGRQVSNFGHVPLFALIAIATLGAVNRFGRRVSRGRPGRYALALGITLMVGLLSEAAQYFGPRDADLGDLARDAIGAVVGLIVVASFDRSLLDRLHVSGRQMTRALRAGALLLLIVSVAPVLIWAESYRRRANALPGLCRFESAWETMFLDTHGARLEVTEAPTAWTGHAGGRVGKISFVARRYPTLMLTEPYPDWSSFDSLRISFFSEAQENLQLTLRVDDIYRNDSYGDRFNRRIVIVPGESRIEIPLLEIRAGPDQRELDLSSIYLVMLFASWPYEPFSVFVDDIELSRAGEDLRE